MKLATKVYAVIALSFAALSFSPASANEYQIENLSVSDRAVFESAAPTLDIFAEEVEAARLHSNGTRTDFNVGHDRRHDPVLGETFVGEAIEAVVFSDSHINIRVAGSVLQQYETKTLDFKKLVTKTGDFIVELREVGQNHTQWVVTNYWGAAETR